MHQFEYQRFSTFFAQVAQGFEPLFLQELADLGIHKTNEAYRGVRFTTDSAGLYRVVYNTRLATRILAPLLTFDCHSARYLYQTVRDMPWEDVFAVDQSFAVFSQVSNSKIQHNQYAAQKTKDAIVDRFRDLQGKRPDVDRKDPHLWINLHVQNNRATIALDAAGGALHKRGYRIAGHEAPMQETLAAAIIRKSGYDGSQPLLDPMCGSGTLLAEACLAAEQRPGGFLRKRFGFESFPDFDLKTWKTVRHKAQQRLQPFPEAGILGGDLDAQALRGCRKNISQLPNGQSIQLEQKDFQDQTPTPGTLIITNPPYGLRLQKGANLNDFYKRIGDWLKQSCTGCSAFIYFGERQYLKQIGLRAAWKLPLRNGPLDGRLARFDLY